MNSLNELITKKEFEGYQNGLVARFEADKMIYTFQYSERNGIASIIVNLSKDTIETQIIIGEDGSLSFQYVKENHISKNKFRDCTSDDFHNMIAHAFIYLRDGNFDYHKEWFAGLRRA